MDFLRKRKESAKNAVENKTQDIVNTEELNKEMDSFKNNKSTQNYQNSENSIENSSQTFDDLHSKMLQIVNKCDNKSINYNNNNENIKLYNNYEICLFMIQLVIKNAIILQKIHSIDEKFSFLSEKMTEIGFNQFDANVCKTYFTAILRYYAEVIIIYLYFDYL